MARSGVFVSTRFGAAGQENDHGLLHLLFETGSVIVVNDLDISSLASLRRHLTPEKPVIFGHCIRTATTGPSCFITKTDPADVVRRYSLSLDIALNNKSEVVTSLAAKKAELAKVTLLS